MSGWMIVAIVAIVMWGIVTLYKMRQDERRGVVRDMYDNAVPMPAGEDAAVSRELEELRERIKVLERIATDGNTLDASETRRISAEIDALRDQTAR